MPLVPHVSSGQIVASTWGNLVADHVVMRFATAAQRTSQLVAPILGQLTTLDTAPGQIDYWTGTAWAPTRELSYTQITAPVTVAPTAAASAVAVVTGPATTFDGTPVMVEFFAGLVAPPSVANGQIMFNLWDGAVDLGYFGSVVTPGGALAVPVTIRRRLSPTAGSHTYSVRAWCPTGTNGSVQAGAGGAPGTYPPAYLAVARAT